MNKRSYSLRHQLVISTLLVHVVLTPLLFGGLIYIVQQGYQYQFVNDARTNAYTISKSVAYANRSIRRNAITIVDDLILSGRAVFAELAVTDSINVLRSEYQLPDFEFTEDFFFGEHGDDTYYIAIAVIDDDDTQHGVLKIGFDESSTKDQINEAYQRGIYLVVIYLVIGLVLASIIATHLTKPLQNLRDQSYKISSGSTDEVFNVKSNVTEVQGLADDMEKMRSKLVKQANALEYQALHDMLTGLFNREMLKASVEQACFKEERVEGRFAFLLMDLDRFKEVNDTLGHDYGDNVLQTVANRINDTIRDYDMVSRLGGDEFGVLLYVDDFEAANVVANNLKTELGRSMIVKECTVHIGVSIGIAMYPDDGEDYQTLLQRADVAMYRAKFSGFGVARYNKEFDPHSPELLSLTGELKSNIHSEEFQLYYQPKIELQSGKIIGVEALLRWIHPERGLLLPDQFIPIAEKTGIIEALTLRVFKDALEKLNEWQAQGLKISVAINISVKNLLNPTFFDQIDEMLQGKSIPHGNLIMEITESALLTDPHHAQRILEQLNQRGIIFSIDDFGTGYSSLAYLKRLPVTELKIDKIFIRDLTISENDRAIVKATIDMARNLGLQIVSEGVEDKETCELLTTLGCDIGQGYYFSPPVDSEAIEKLLLDNQRPLVSRV